MATNPTVEGDGTALYISNLLGGLPVRITRLARGITTGSVLEFANKEILADAMTGRQSFSGEWRVESPKGYIGTKREWSSNPNP